MGLNSKNLNEMEVGATIIVKAGNQDRVISYEITKTGNGTFKVCPGGHLPVHCMISDPKVTKGKSFTYWKDGGGEGLEPRLSPPVISWVDVKADERPS